MGEYGEVTITWVNPKSKLFKGVVVPFKVWMSHGDELVEVPKGYMVSALTENGVIAGVEHEQI